MLKRLELHNHTTESDGGMTCRELAAYMEADGVDAFALTDHNTISGHEKMRRILNETNGSLSCIYGMEYTTYYGHILCLNLKDYVPWETIDRRHPEQLFSAVRKKGALAGIAHPFSFGAPFAKGCRFEMELTDYSCLDFIEIFNDYEPLHPVNEPALHWWESLVLAGHPIAATCGMDLHGRLPFAGQYATYIEGQPEGMIARELETAIKGRRTWVSKGPLLLTEVDGPKGLLRFSIVQTGKNGYDASGHPPYYMELKTRKEAIIRQIQEHKSLELPLSALGGEQVAIPKLYEADVTIENLLCTAPAVKLCGGEAPLGEAP